MKIVHICDGWQAQNGAANIARLIGGEQGGAGHDVVYRRFAGISELRAADEVWIHCGWKPCLWWAALWAKKAFWMPEACYDPIRRAYHGWKKRLVGPIERWALRRCDRLVATCAAEAEWIRAYAEKRGWEAWRFGGSRRLRIEITDLKRFFKLDLDERSSFIWTGTGRPLHLLYLGRRHPLKGVEFLERAVMEIGLDQRSRSRVELRIVSDHFGEELERDWAWCDALVLPTLSDNFGLVVAEALERGKRVITTDGAPVWEGQPGVVYLKGYRDGTDAKRVELLKRAVERFLVEYPA